jgi:hypothetical protein
MSKTKKPKPSERYSRMPKAEYLAMARAIHAADPDALPSPRGGARVGAGRKPKPNDQKAARVMLTLDPDLLAAADAAANAAGMTRAGFVADTLRKRLKLRRSA